jgi:hypothetical protein
MGTRRLRREALHCCPACAASVGTRAHRPHRPRTHAPRPWTWLALLAVTAAMIPVAAMEGGRGGATALAAAVAAPAPTAARAIVAATVADPPAPPPEAVVWRDSVAHGTPNAGSLEGGVRLPAEGPGYYTYNPATQEPPGGRDRTWGTAMLVREVRSVARWWAGAHPDAPRLGIGDLSRESGGSFTGPAVGHASHQNGLDVDVRLVRRDGTEAAVDPGTYDRALTQELVNRFLAAGASHVFVGPSLDLHGPNVMVWPNHDDHLHVRFPDPDGTSN